MQRHNPNASKERLEALALRAQRDFVERKITGSPVRDPELTLRPDLTKTLRKNTDIKYYHSGKWEKQPYEETEAWSCCMNVEHKSEGCVAVNNDRRKWNISSY